MLWDSAFWPLGDAGPHGVPGLPGSCRSSEPLARPSGVGAGSGHTAGSPSIPRRTSKPTDRDPVSSPAVYPEPRVFLTGFIAVAKTWCISHWGDGLRVCSGLSVQISLRMPRSSLSFTSENRHISRMSTAGAQSLDTGRLTWTQDDSRQSWNVSCFLM